MYPGFQVFIIGYKLIYLAYNCVSFAAL